MSPLQFYDSDAYSKPKKVCMYKGKKVSHQCPVGIAHPNLLLLRSSPLSSSHRAATVTALDAGVGAVVKSLKR